MAAIEAAKAAYNRAQGEVDSALAASYALPDNASVAELERSTAALELASGNRERAHKQITILEKAAGETFEQIERSGGRMSVTEKRNYVRGGPNSFFGDAFNASVGGDYDARQRIERHSAEVRVHGEMPAGEEHATTTTSYAGLVVPQYLVDYAALVLRNGRPLANAITKLPLPSQGTTFQVPRGTTGASEAIQATENASVSSTDEVWANVTLTMATIAGQQDVSRQSIERGTPGIDELIYTDLAGAYAAQLDSQIISGSGASGQLLGILNTASINAATLFGAAPTAANFTSKLAGQIAAIAGAGTAIQPRIIVMHPRRWGWLQSLSDSTGRPLAVAQPMGPFNAAGLIALPGGYSGDGPSIGGPTQFVGMLANGLPVLTDANIPITVGTNSEDVVLVLDTQQILLWEDGDGMPRRPRFEQTLGNQLTVKLVAYGYSAFTAGRYPAAVGKIGGLDSTATFGLVAPTF